MHIEMLNIILYFQGYSHSHRSQLDFYLQKRRSCLKPKIKTHLSASNVIYTISSCSHIFDVSNILFLCYTRERIFFLSLGHHLRLCWSDILRKNLSSLKDPLIASQGVKNSGQEEKKHVCTIIGKMKCKTMTIFSEGLDK